jgi:P4 family phage/plasmid primase-like protien
MMYEKAVEYNKKYGFVVVSEYLKRVPKCVGWNKFTQADCISKQEQKLKEGGIISTRTGEPSGYAVIDVDMDKDGGDTNVKLWRRLTEVCGFPNTWTVKSGGGGLHLYYKWRPEYESFVSKHYAINNNQTGEQLVFEFKGNGGKVILPPSLHHRTGNKYVWLNHPDNTDLSELPEFITKYLEVKNTHFEQTTEDLGTDNGDIKAFEQSEWFSRNYVRLGTDSKGRTNYRTPHRFDCKICKREHKSLQHVPFLWKNHNGLFFTCRKGQKGGTKCIINYSEGLKKCFYGVEADTADYLIDYVLKDNYKCCSEKDKLYYYFDGNVWRRDEDENHIYKIVRNDLLPKIDIYLSLLGDECKSLLKQVTACSDEGEKEKLKEQLQKINNVQQKGEKYKQRVQKKAFIMEVQWHIGKTLQDLSFYSKLDTNSDLIAFNDCVYDLSTKTMREGKPDDCISLTTGYDFPTQSQGCEEEIITFFKQLYPNEELRIYMIRQLAQVLCGKRRKSVHFHTGDGNNGKSTIFNLLQLCMGDYASKIGNAVYTQTNSESVGKPEYDKLKGVRLAYASEPKSTSRINESFVKDFTGGEELVYRLLFSNKIQSFVPQAHLHILCNKMPSIDGEDGGIQNRTRVADYVSKYVKQDEVDESQNKYLLIECFEETLKKWRDDTILILLNEYHDEDNNTPSMVTTSTNKYLKANSDGVYFVSEYLEKGNSDDYITMKDIMSVWKEDQQCRSLKLKQAQVAEMLEKALKTSCKERGKVKNRCLRSYFLGWKFQHESFYPI